MRFDAVKAGHVFEHKGGQYVKLADHRRPAEFNAMTTMGVLVHYYPYDEVLDLGPFTKERRPARAGKK